MSPRVKSSVICPAERRAASAGAGTAADAPSGVAAAGAAGPKAGGEGSRAIGPSAASPADRSCTGAVAALPLRDGGDEYGTTGATGKAAVAAKREISG